MKKKFLFIIILCITVLLLASCNRKPYPLNREVDYPISHVSSSSIITTEGKTMNTCSSDTIIGDEKFALTLSQKDSFGHRQAVLFAYNLQTGAQREVINVGSVYFCKVNYYDDNYALIMYNGYVILVDIFSGEILKKDTLFEHPERYTRYNYDTPYYVSGEPCFYEKGTFAYVQYENGSFIIDRMTVDENLTFICTIDGYYYFGNPRFDLSPFNYATPTITYDMKTHEERTDNLDKLYTLRDLQAHYFYSFDFIQQGEIVSCNCNPFFEKKSYHEHSYQQANESLMVYLDETAEEIEKTIDDTSNIATLYSTALSSCFRRASLNYYFKTAEETENDSSHTLFVDVEGSETTPYSDWYNENKGSIAQLFGFDNYEAFLEKIQTIKSEYQKIEDPAQETNRLLLDGFVLTKNGFALSPFAFYSPSLVGILALTPKGKCYLWLNDTEIISSVLEKERIMLSRCILYETGRFIEYAGKKMTYAVNNRYYSDDGTTENPVYFTLFDGTNKIVIDHNIMKSSPSYLATTMQEGMGFFGKATDIYIQNNRMILVFIDHGSGIMHPPHISYFEYDYTTNTVHFIVRVFGGDGKLFVW